MPRIELMFQGEAGERAVLESEEPSVPPAEYGEVFTRRWVVDLILDLVGYDPQTNLSQVQIVEPACGSGAFLIPIVERLMLSASTHGVTSAELADTIRAYDIQSENVERSRKAAVEVLLEHGCEQTEADRLADTWVTEADFLLLDPGAPADFVVGNPPYVRLESIDKTTMDGYRTALSTMRGRADIYVGFFERGLARLKDHGVLGFICADRWMRNQYGADLRELITSKYAVDAVITMHDVDAFEDDVSAYPAVVVLRNDAHQRTTVADTSGRFSAGDAERLVSWVKQGRTRSVHRATYDASRVATWFQGRAMWPAGRPDQLAVLADLEQRFAPLEDEATGTRVGIGVATGCDAVFIAEDAPVESDRLLPLARVADIKSGAVEWTGHHLVNPWNEAGLVDLAEYPRLRRYLQKHKAALKARHVAQRRKDHWYRTIDRVDSTLLSRPKLLIPDLRATAHPVLDSGQLYPHHNLYYVVSDVWDLEVLGGLLLSEIANLFVGAYCVRMRGGTYRFQAQYLRRIRVPRPEEIGRRDRDLLRAAFRRRDAEAATAVARRVYGLAI